MRLALRGLCGILALALAVPAAGSREQVRALIADERYDEAVAQGRSWLAQAEAAHGAASLPAAEAAELLARAMAAGRIGEKAERLALAERAVSIKRRLLGPDDAALASALYVVGLVHNLTADAAAALPRFEEALRIADAASGTIHPELDVFVREYGTALYGVGRYREAKAVFERHLALCRANPVADYSATWQGLFNLALVHKVLGDWDEAERLYLEALRLVEGHEPPDMARLGWTLQSRANLLERQGRGAEALETMQRALVLRRREHGAESIEVASALNNLGLLCRKLGDLDQARAHLESSLAIQRKLEAGADLGLRTRFNLAAVKLDASDAAGARALLDEAWRLAAPVLSPQDAVWGTYHMHYADVLERLGDRAGARQQLSRALLRVSGVGEEEFTAECLNRLGRLDLAAGDPAAAREHLERALAIVTRRFGDHRHPLPLDVLEALAETYAADGERGLAFATAIEGAGIRRSLAVEILAVLPERQAMAFAARPSVGRNVALTLALATDDSALAAGAYDAVIGARAVVFDELAARQRFYGVSADPRLREATAALRAAKTRLANLFVMGQESDAGRLATAREEIETLETQLARGSAAFRARRATRAFDHAALRRALAGGDACISYVRYEHRAGAYYAAAVLRSDAPAPVLVDLGPAEPLESAIAAWRRTFETERDERGQREAGERLRRALWDPVARRVAGASIVFIVPDGAIHLVTFAALPVGENGYLIESGPSFHYLTAERDLANRGLAATGGRGLLALGDPAFDDGVATAVSVAGDDAIFRGASPDCPSFRSLRFGALPAAAGEALAVKEIWGERHGDAEPAALLVGRSATEAAVKRQLPGKRVLHLATHGFFLEGGCGGSGSSRGIGGVSPRRPAAKDEDRIPADPLLLSGLALAGANQRGKTGEDGILTAEEVSALDLSSVELAVLSACRTGAGRVEPGEGVFGLRRAFLVAGVRAVVTNLWDVEDRAALAWIEGFYRERLLRGRELPEAARRASLALLEARRAKGLGTHPFYWAGWLTVGNPD